jgi:hypothetical protein
LFDEDAEKISKLGLELLKVTGFHGHVSGHQGVKKRYGMLPDIYPLVNVYITMENHHF